MDGALSLQDDKTEIFWAEIAPCDHVLQIYDGEGEFFHSLESFVVGGLREQEVVVLIATPQHLAGLERRLWSQHFDLIAGARSRDQYITFDAGDTLSRFMVNNWPDERLFREQISSILVRARSRGKRVRAFGEMVALLWARGMSGATVRLEHLWNHFCEQEGLPLLCAYPKSGFTKDADDSMREICAAHNKSFHCH